MRQAWSGKTSAIDRKAPHISILWATVVGHRKLALAISAPPSAALFDSVNHKISMDNVDLTRRRFLWGLSALSAAGIMAVGDATLIGARYLKVTRLEVRLTNLSPRMDGFTVAQIGDFHYDTPLTAGVIKAAVDVVNNLNPDLVVLMGDYVRLPWGGWDHASHRARARAEAVPCAGLLEQLRPKIKSVGILGNHDATAGSEAVAEALTSVGLQILRNQATVIEHDGARLWVAGVDDVLEGKPDLDSALRVIPKGDPVIVLAHEPDFADEVAAKPVDLQLSGHSHGGQIRLPLFGPLDLPDLGRRYPMGLYRKRNLTLYTNCGLGTVKVPARLNCPPEVTVICLRSSV